MGSSRERKQQRERERPVRAHAAHIPKWQRFQPRMIKQTEMTTSVESTEKELFAYQKQYSHVYSHRLTALKNRCWTALAKAGSSTDNSVVSGGEDPLNGTGEIIKVNRVLELQEDQVSQIVGTLVKDITDPKEGTIITSSSPSSETVCRPSDQLFLEDESGRVALTGTDVHTYCTGVVVGIQGKVDQKGNLHVQTIVPPVPLSPTPPADVNSSSSIDGGGDDVPITLSEPAGLTPHLLLVSSLLCGDPSVSSLPREMLVGYLQGQFTDDASKVCRIVVAGSGPSSTTPLDGLRELDMWGVQVCSADGGIAIPIDLMPSSTDPTTRNWPQRPLHSCLLPHARRPMLFLPPNPYEALYANNKVVIGTDGLNVRDLQRHVLVSSRRDDDDDVDDDVDRGTAGGDGTVRRLTELEALERTLEWSHLCPTGPDSLGMVPHDDPMVMSGCAPHVYFCGNCEEGFATKVSSTNGITRLICVPKFSDTGEAVLVNLETLEVELLRFRADDDDL